MTQFLVQTLVDTDRDVYGNTWGANFDDPDGKNRCEDGEVYSFAGTFGAEAGAQWDDNMRPSTQTLRVDQLGDGREESIVDKVFDTDGNPIAARLLVWGPEDVDGEACLIVEPTDFFSTAPNEHYDGQLKPVNSADDLRLAIPLRLGFASPPEAPHVMLCPECGSEDVREVDGAGWKCGNCSAEDFQPIETTEEATPYGVLGEAHEDAMTTVPSATAQLDDELVCRTMGADLHMKRAEFDALLGHLQEGSPVIRRRIEVLLGEKTLAQVDAEADQEQREKESRVFTVIAIYAEGGQGFAESVEAESVEDAEESVISAAEAELRIVGVVEGSVAMVDNDPEATG